MNKLNSFLWKLFSITMVLSWESGNIAFADDTDTETQDTHWGVYSKGRTGKFQTICPAGQYVYACGSYKVGYNWLKSVTLTAPNGTTKTTNDYYIGDNTFDKMEQMRAFFNRNQIIKYKKDSDNVYTSDSSDKIIQNDKDFILGLLCNPLNSSTTITCAQCPDGGTVSNSGVRVGSDINYEETDLLLIRNSWDFNTIADCYISEFEDATGSFIYVPNNATVEADTIGEQCFYTNDNPSALQFISGDQISSFASGGNNSSIQTITPDIPE